ncbi:alpha/beta hydrolase [Terrabacter sp. NPDC000476]|uniref:alpha/beta hydrolase n=1 Tax=Terrabacter sp. NPDC000476 TaxID=3154258 RepID=UPI003327258B
MTAATLAGGPGIREIREARPAVLLAVARRLEERRATVLRCTEVLLWRRSAVTRWSGPAARAALARHAFVVDQLSRLGRSLAATGHALGRAARRLEAAADLVRRADRRAAAEGAWVDPDGVVLLPVRASLGEPLVEAHRTRLDALLLAEVHACLHEAQRAARELDEELARALLESARGSDPTAGASPGAPAGAATVRPSPPPSGVAGGVPDLVFSTAAWWRSLTAEEQRWVLRERPEWVGARDGVPAGARHEANLTLLVRAERTAYGRVQELGHDGAPWDAGERTRAQERVDGLRAIREVLARRDGVQRQLLLVDTGAPDLRAVVAIGDVDRADHVATYVGGLSTTVGGDLRRYDETFVRMRSEALQLARGGDVAIVTWMGYDAPQLREIVTSIDRNVLSSKLARDNAAALADFVTGVDAARDRPAHTSVWAHSYGGTLAGFAVLRTSVIDDVAVLGAPGMPFADVAKASLAPGSFNVLGAIGDDVFAYGWVVHGTAPAAVAGAVRLSTLALKAPASGCNHWLRPRSDYVDVGRTSVGHSDYLRSGTDSARNLVALAVGRRDLRVLQGDDERACTTTGPSLGTDPLAWPRLLP